VNDESRPEAAHETPAKKSSRIVSPADAWAVIFDAENLIKLEALAIAALAGLTTDQLRAIVWVGLLDNGWSRVFLELNRRGESL
jgi:hypothetical protein